MIAVRAANAESDSLEDMGDSDSDSDAAMFDGDEPMGGDLSDSMDIGLPLADSSSDAAE